MKSKIFKAMLWITVAIMLIISSLWIYIACPTFQKNQKSSVHVDAARLRAHVETLSSRFHPRNYKEIDNLNKCADYISKHFSKAGATVEIQEFIAEGKTYSNIIGRFKKEKKQKIIIGAHYDAVQGTPGADDNASGVGGLIELAYLIGKSKPDISVELVAYNLEEPPFFGTQDMGSAVHAESIDGSQDIAGVIVLEMIGYYDDHKNSQSYPISALKLLYPDRGNFIAIVGRIGQREFIKQIKNAMKGATDLPVYSISAPEFIPGVDFSDHRNYWAHNFNAVMVTDTAFYRNREYHEANDTSDRLDYNRMAEVVIGIFEAIKKL